ncbi:hypothetical protein [Paenibacillus nicotianae]
MAEPVTNVSMKGFQRTDNAQQQMQYITQLQNTIISLSKDLFSMSQRISSLESQVKTLGGG